MSTIYRWRTRYRPDDLPRLEPHSRHPKRTRRATWTAAQEEAVLALRHQYPRMGKRPLQVLLRRQGIRLSASMTGRILGSLRRRSMLREPHAIGNSPVLIHTGLFANVAADTFSGIVDLN